MKSWKILLVATPLLISGCASQTSPQASSQPDCQTAKYIEDINGGNIKRAVHIKGKDAIVFLALDPALSAPEFDYGDNYRDEYFIEAMKNARKSLYESGIDEVIVWRLQRRTLGVAVGFKEGCAVKGYGTPDTYEKLMLMHKSFLLISEHGLDDPLVRDSIKKLVMSTPFSHFYKDEMVDIIIDNLRPLMKR